MKQEYAEAFKKFSKEKDIVWGKPKEGQISFHGAVEISRLKCQKDMAELIGASIVHKLTVDEIRAVVQLYKRNNPKGEK